MISGAGGLTKLGAGNLTLTGPASNTFSGVTTVNAGTLTLAKSTGPAVSRSVVVNGGTLRLAGDDQVASDTILALNGGTVDLQDYSMNAARADVVGAVTFTGSDAYLNGNINGASNSTIQVTGTMAMGNENSYTGFRTTGTLDAGSADLTLNSKGFAALGALTTLNGGSIHAPHGIALGIGSSFSGTGTVNSKVAAGFGSVIEATGSLTLGNNSATDGFYSDGTLAVGHYTVTLNDSNAAVLGSQTTLGDSTGAGTLTGTHGLALEMGKNLTGYGVVNGALLTDGFVQGSGPAPDDGIRFNGAVSGFGDFAGNVTFAGGYLPGHSPDAVNFQNLTLTGTNTLFMELGGTTPDSQYDQLLVGGVLNLSGTLSVSLSNSFQPTAGNLFDLFNWSGLTGHFSILDLPSLTSGLVWDTSDLYTTGILAVETATPPAPADFTATAQPGLTVRLGWQETSPPAVGFEIQRALDEGFTSDLHTVSLPAGQTSYDDASLTPQTVFHYRIRALGSPNPSGFSTPAQAETPTRLADWRWVHFGNPDSSGDGEDLKDFDHDGAVNLLEYACNLDPKTHDARAMTADGTAGLPVVGMTPGGQLQITFLRRTAASLPAVTQGAVFSTDLTHWTPEPAAATTVEPIDALWERVVLTDVAAHAARRFVRTVVTAP